MELPPTSLRPFVTVSTERVLDARIFRVDRVRRRSEARNDEHDYWRLETADWVNIIPITRRGELVLVRQERHGIGANTLEIPGGLVDLGEAPAAAALRELREETGYQGATAEPLGWLYPKPPSRATSSTGSSPATSSRSARPTPTLTRRSRS